ncbi:MAG: hypothetical protein ABI325_08000, partial [Ginsengibacter sp.]
KTHHPTNIIHHQPVGGQVLSASTGKIRLLVSMFCFYNKGIPPHQYQTVRACVSAKGFSPALYVKATSCFSVLH